MRIVFAFASLLVFACLPAAADAPAAPVPYAVFTKGLVPQRGSVHALAQGWKSLHRASKNQLDSDFIQTAEPASGLGGYGITPGLPYLQFARIIRFSRVDDNVTISWPNTSFVANSDAAAAVAQISLRRFWQ